MFVLNGLTDKKVTQYITNILAKTKIERKEVMFAQSPNGPNGPNGYVSHLKEKRKKEIVNNTSSSCKDINHLKKKQKKKKFSLLTNQLCSFPFIVTQKVQNKREGGASCADYGTELERSTGTWWGGTVSESASSWLEKPLVVAVLGGGGVEVLAVVVRVVLMTLLLLVVVVLVQLAAGVVACSSLGCLLANSVMLKTNWRQPSLM